MSIHAEPVEPIIEKGWNSSLDIVGSEVIKTSPLAGAYETRAAADEVADGLRNYASELGQQPLRVASLHGVDVVEHPEGYKVKHTYEQIQGPSLTRLPAHARQGAMRDLLARVGTMDTFADHDTLVVPFDAKSDNFHVDASGPALTDIFPALSRKEDGGFPYHMFADARKAKLFAWTMGTKTGAMTTLLSTAVERGDSPAAKVKHIIRDTDDWAYDTLPPDLPAHMRDVVRRQIGMHFLPYMARVARHKIGR